MVSRDLRKCVVSVCVLGIGCRGDCVLFVSVFFFQAEDGIRDLVRSRGLGDVYKRQVKPEPPPQVEVGREGFTPAAASRLFQLFAAQTLPCLLYTSDAADDLLCVDLGGRRIIKKKNQEHNTPQVNVNTHHPTT